MLMPSEDGFLTQLQETGSALATLTGSDDLAVAVPALVAKAATAGLDVRVYPEHEGRSLYVQVREGPRSGGAAQ